MPVRTGYSFLLDQLCFFNVLTGDSLYTARHADAYEHWAPRLSAGALQQVRDAAEFAGFASIGLWLCQMVSFVPGFDRRSAGDLLDAPDLFRGYFGKEQAGWEKAAALCAMLRPVAHELEARDFRGYWSTECMLPIKRALRSLEGLAVPEEADDLLGPSAEGRVSGARLYMGCFVAPHAVRLCNDAFLTDMRHDPRQTVRLAIHELFHPPYRAEEVADVLNRLAADPLFQASHRERNPRYGYADPHDFLEENVVEAMELLVSERAGLVSDATAYLLEHDGGSHKLSLVLLKYFRQFPKIPHEEFATYFRRVAGWLPIGHLDSEYEIELEQWRRTH